MSDSVRIPNLAIRRIREVERQESRSEFAEALARKAAELGESVSPSERYVARLEDGDIRYPYPAYRRILTELCGRSITDLGFDRPKAENESTRGREVISSAREPESRIHPWPHVVSLHQVEEVRGMIGERIGRGAIVNAELDDWELSVLQYGRATRYQEPQAMLFDLATDLADLSRIVVEARSASSARRITRVIAQMAGLACLMYIKLGDRISFRNWARTARIAAEEAGDPLTLSWIRAHESYGYYYSGEILQAIITARHAQHVSGGVPCVGSALAAALEARAHASLGASHGADAQLAIRRAEDILGNLSSSDVVPSAFGYTEGQLRFHQGSSLTHLRNTHEAWKAQERALELVLDEDYTDRALTRLDRAVCLAHDRDVNSAFSYAAETLSCLTPDQRRGIIDARARDMIRAVPPREHHLPAVRSFREVLAISNEERTNQ